MAVRMREPLTRERVIEAALRVMDAEGLEAVTMRRIAREVGVEAMSLYHHVRDKDDLLDAICEHVMSRFELPELSGDWDEDCRRAARAWRNVLRQHPNVMALLAQKRGPVRSIESLRPMEMALRLLRAAGLSERDTAQAFNAFGGYIQGFVMMELGSIAGGLDAEHVRSHEELAAGLSDEFAALRAVAPHLAECDPDEQFEFGLDLLIRGLEGKVKRASEPTAVG